MPHASIKLKPGVDLNETPALNETGISYSNLIRFIYDKTLGGLIQKLGGWTKFYPYTFAQTIRALWAWETTQSVAYLALGTQSPDSSTAASLSVISYSPPTIGAANDITPTQTITNIAASTVVPTVGSPYIVINDTSVPGITQYDSVYIATHISVGGVVLFGLYQCDPNGYLSSSSYSVLSTDVLGNSLPASAIVLPTSAASGDGTTATISFSAYPLPIPPPVGSTITVAGVTPNSGGTGGTGYNGTYVVTASTTTSVSYLNTITGAQTVAGTVSIISKAVLAQFTTSNTSSTVTVTLPYHGYSVGSTYPVLVSTAINGITLYGNYIVQTVVNAAQFTITGGNVANNNGSAYINSNLARYIYNFGVGAVPSGTGYGIGPYGIGGYGTGSAVTPSTGTKIIAYDWTLDNWGEILIACPNNPDGYSGTPYSPIYGWNGSGGAPSAQVLPAAPAVNEGVFMAMPQRQLIAYGTSFTGIQDPLLIRWCDVNNFGVWIGTVTNQAGSYRIPKGSRIVGGIQGPQQGLLWTDVGLWAMQYVGPSYVYSFNEIGSGCGMIAKKAAASVNGITYWMGPSQFYMLAGSGVEPLPCPIWDVIFQNLDASNLQKIRVAVNSRFGEISWFYPTTTSGGEVSNYVKFNVYLQVWDFGAIGRTAWVDQSVLGPPIGADPSSRYIYQHETSTDADGQPLLSNFQTGYFTLNEGDLKTFVDQVWPDMKWGYYNGVQNATVNLTFYVADYPGQTPLQYGPFAMTQQTTFISPRFRGRLVSVGLSSTDIGSFWRLGNIRYRSQQDGKF